MESDDPTEVRHLHRAGDPRLMPDDRAILRWITTGDLADEFAGALAEVSANDPITGGLGRTAPSMTFEDVRGLFS